MYEQKPFICGQISLTPRVESSFCYCFCSFLPLNLPISELWGHISPILFRVDPHVFCFPPFFVLRSFDETVKLFPVGFIKMMFIHSQFNLMSTNSYFDRHCNKPINKTAVFLLYKFIFPLAHHYRYVVGQYT